jgi:hypothetical protein
MNGSRRRKSTGFFALQKIQKKLAENTTNSRNMSRESQILG